MSNSTKFDSLKISQLATLTTVSPGVEPHSTVAGQPRGAGGGAAGGARRGDPAAGSGAHVIWQT